MKREDIYKRIFDLEFCEPSQKVAKDQELNDVFKKACEAIGKPLYVLKPAILKCYPRYRAERLRNELRSIPQTLRGQ